MLCSYLCSMLWRCRLHNARVFSAVRRANINNFSINSFPRSFRFENLHSTGETNGCRNLIKSGKACHRCHINVFAACDGRYHICAMCMYDVIHGFHSLNKTKFNLDPKHFFFAFFRFIWLRHETNKQQTRDEKAAKFPLFFIKWNQICGWMLPFCSVRSLFNIMESIHTLTTAGQQRRRRRQWWWWRW